MRHLAIVLIVVTLAAAARAQDLPAWRTLVDVSYEADSVAGVVERAKPSFTWGDGDMLWINRDAAGNRRFTVDRAIALPESQGRRWALVRLKRYVDYAWFLDGEHLREEIAVVTEPPRNDGPPPSHALAVAALPSADAILYRIRWTSGPTTGNGQYHRVRDIFVIHGTGGRWQFVGEGGTETYGRSDPGTYSLDSLEYRYKWSSAGGVAIYSTRTICRGAMYETTPPARAELVAHREGTLDPATRQMRWGEHEYIVAGPNEKLDAIIERAASWQWNFYWERYKDRRADFVNAMRPLILDLNPRTPRRGELPLGHRVLLPTYQECERALQGSPATRPAR